MKIAVIEKCPSSNRYEEYFKFEYDLYRLSSVRLSKVLKRDVDIEFNPDDYDYVILVGSEAAKYYAKITAVTDFAGHLVNDKFIPLVNPAMIVFKPENKPQFLVSVERLHKVLEGINLVNNSGTWLGIQDTKTALEYLDLVDSYASETGVLALDTETTALYPHDGYVLGISICAREQNAAYIDTECIDSEVEAKFQYLFNKYKVVFHNAKFDVKMLQYHFGFKFPDLEDTLVLHYVLDETQGSHGLKSLALKYTEFGAYDSDLDEFKKNYCKEHGLLESEFSYERIPFNIMYVYAAKDTGATLELYNKFKPLVSANSRLSHVYDTLLMPALRALVDIELAGVPFDRRRLQFAQATIDKAIADATKHLYSLPEVIEFEKEQGKEFNPNSVLQLRKLLFDKLGLIPLAKKTGTGLQSTDAEVLESLDGQHEVVNSIISIRKLGKIKNTYVDNLLLNLDSDGRVRTGFNLTSTTSGRLSSSGKFNAQQLPREEKRVKGAIKGTGKYEGWKIVSQDLVTGEVYIAAVLSGDKKLQQIFIDKKDFHSSIAKEVFSLPCAVEDVKTLFKDKRQAAKAVTFSILYGAGASKVSDTVSKDSESPFTLADAQEAIDLYFETYSALKKWLKNVEAEIKSKGFIYTSFGRKRRLKNVFSPDKGIASHEIRSGINAAVQALCSDINLLATIDMVAEIKRLKLRAEIFMLVHDSIVAIVHPDDVALYCEILAKCTQKDRGFSIPNCPIGIDQEIGDDYAFGAWDDEWKECFDDYFGENQMASVPNKS